MKWTLSDSMLGQAGAKNVLFSRYLYRNIRWSVSIRAKLLRVYINKLSIYDSVSTGL